jgi:hypothetical protein
MISRPGSVTASTWLLYSIAASLGLFILGVAYEQANYAIWAHAVGTRLGTPRSTIAADVSANTHLDVGAFVIVGVVVGLFLWVASLVRRRRRVGQFLAYLMMGLFAFSLIAGILSSSGSDTELSPLDQAINNAEPVWASIGTTWALIAAAPLSVAGLVTLSWRPSRRWFGPPIALRRRVITSTPNLSDPEKSVT